MGFIKNLFGKKTIIASARLLVNEDFGKKIWQMGENQGDLGTVKVGSVDLKVSLLLYSIAKINELNDKVRATKRSRLNATETAIDFFIFGLGTVAGSIKDAGGDFALFDRIHRSLITLFQTQWRPVAEQIDKGKKPASKANFHLDLTLPVDSKFKPSDVRFWAQEGMAPLLEFLNSYA
jgi:hypothetical protein